MNMDEINQTLSLMTKQNENEDVLKQLEAIEYQIQKFNDSLSSGLTSYNMKEMRNTYVINAQDSLDDSYPMYVYFNIIPEMTKIVSVAVDFWIMNFRSYSKAALSGGGDTSGASSSSTTASGGGTTRTSEEENKGAVLATQATQVEEINNVGDENISGFFITSGTSVPVSDYDHTHEISIPDHTHGMSHTHSTPDHTHDISYGIYEEDNSPKISFYVANNEGVSYSEVFGPYTKNQSQIHVTSKLEGPGSKVIKFESSARARLSVQVTVKLDIKAR